jgi:hypothetical protein
VEEKVIGELWGDPLVRDFLTPREEKVKKNRLRKLLAESHEQLGHSLRNISDRINLRIASTIDPRVSDDGIIPFWTMRYRFSILKIPGTPSTLLHKNSRSAMPFVSFVIQCC